VINFYNPNIKRERETVSSSPKGLDFVRVAIADALHSGDTKGAERYARSRWGTGSRAARLTAKAALPGLSTQADGGDQMVGDEGASAEFFELVAASSVLGRLPVRRIGFNTATLSMDEGARVEWAGEGKGKRTSPLKLTRQTGLDRFKVAALIVSTNEMLSQSDVGAELIIRNELVRALARAVDSAFLDPANSGSANVKPASVTNGAAGISDSPSEAMWEFYDTFTGDPDLAWLIMHPFTAARLYGAARPDIGARGGSWGGFPVLTSSVVEADTVVFLDPSQIAVAMEGPEIRSSTQATVELADSSTQDSVSVTGTNLSSMFQNNSTAILGDLWANWRVMKPEAVMTFTVQQFGL
jgi:hypothetical protein